MVDEGGTETQKKILRVDTVCVWLVGGDPVCNPPSGRVAAGAQGHLRDSVAGSLERKR